MDVREFEIIKSDLLMEMEGTENQLFQRKVSISTSNTKVCFIFIYTILRSSYIQVVLHNCLRLPNCCTNIPLSLEYFYN